MTTKKQKSFWDLPDWYCELHNGKTGCFLSLAGWIGWLIWTAMQRRYAETYALASPLIAYALFRIVGVLLPRSRRTASGCLALPFTALAGFLLFGPEMLHHDVNLVLVGASCLAVVLLLVVIIIRYVVPRFTGPKVCADCGQRSSYVLLGTKRGLRLCRGHFVERLRSAIEEYEGRFLIVERDLTAKPKQAQYVFYGPGDLLDDCYYVSDVESVERLTGALMTADETTPAFVAVMVPNEAITKIGDADDEHLLRMDIEEIRGKRLDKAALLLYLERVISDYDSPGREFNMNLPRGTSGIYLWHNYV